MNAGDRRTPTNAIQKDRDGGIGRWCYFVLLTVGILSRLLPHPPNVTAIAAIGLFAGSRGQSGLGWFVPVAALLITDLCLGGYTPLSMLFVYAGFAAGGAVGRYWLRGRRSMGRVASASILTSTLFFFISNFGWWLAGSGYEHTVEGLLACYVAGLPWFGSSLLGDLCYSLVLIGGFDWLVSTGHDSLAFAKRGAPGDWRLTNSALK